MGAVELKIDDEITGVYTFDRFYYTFNIFVFGLNALSIY